MAVEHEWSGSWSVASSWQSSRFRRPWAYRCAQRVLCRLLGPWRWSMPGVVFVWCSCGALAVHAFPRARRRVSPAVAPRSRVEGLCARLWWARCCGVCAVRACRCACCLCVRFVPGRACVCVRACPCVVPCPVGGGRSLLVVEKKKKKPLRVPVACAVSHVMCRQRNPEPRQC